MNILFLDAKVTGLLESSYILVIVEIKPSLWAKLKKVHEHATLSDNQPVICLSSKEDYLRRVVWVSQDP